jgi:hypothetical protein
MTLGAAATAGVRLIVWCKNCQHQVEPDPAEHARRYGAETSVLARQIGLFPVRRPPRRHGCDWNEAIVPYRLCRRC